MARIRLTTADDTEVTAKSLEQTLADYFPIVKLEKIDTALWYLYLPDYPWSMSDADFLETLANKRDLLAGWHYQGN